jgi:phosphate transport system protein
MSEYHTLRNFDSELQVIESIVAEMGGLVERQVADAVTALVRRDPVQAERVVSTDMQIDELQHEIEQKTVISIVSAQRFGSFGSLACG